MSPTNFNSQCALGARITEHSSAAPGTVGAVSPELQAPYAHGAWAAELLPAVSLLPWFLRAFLSSSPGPCPPGPSGPVHLVTVQHSQVDFHRGLVFPQGRGRPGIQVHADSHILGAGAHGIGRDGVVGSGGRASLTQIREWREGGGGCVATGRPDCLVRAGSGSCLQRHRRAERDDSQSLLSPGP